MILDWLARDGKVILVEKSVRTIPYGFLGVLFGVYLSQLGFDPVAIGIVLTVTVASSAFYTVVASLVADRLGRKKTLIFFALMDSLAAVFLLISTAWWAPVIAGIVGNMTVGAGEVGPYLSLEQAILPKSADYKHRTLAFSIYNLTGYASSSAGSLLAGLPQYFGPGPAGYKPLFLAYLISGFLGAFLYSTLSKRTEQEAQSTGQPRRVLSDSAKPVVLKLSALFAIDSFGGGFIGQSMISYYFYQRYPSLDLGSLGLIFAATNIITAGSFLVSARIVEKVGLIKTMVFSHVPSNIFLASVPFAPTAATGVFLLLCRQSLSQMDVPARQSYVVSLVPESDRTAASGITNVSRTVASSFSPSLAGYAIANVWLGSPFVISGVLKLVYDASLYKSFRSVKPTEEQA